eukprot:COSAG03_NODE_563_length_6926_cov_121.943899_5_plen_83_part_00
MQIKCFYSRTAALLHCTYLGTLGSTNAMKEVLLELLRVQYAPNAPKGHRSILYMIIDKGHKDKGHKALCPLSVLADLPCKEC